MAIDTGNDTMMEERVQRAVEHIVRSCIRCGLERVPELTTCKECMNDDLMRWGLDARVILRKIDHYEKVLANHIAGRGLTWNGVKE